VAGRRPNIKLLRRHAPFQQIVHRLPAGVDFLIQPRQFAQRRHRVLPGAAGRAARLDQRPVIIRRVIYPAAIAAQIHAGILRPSLPPRNGLLCRSSGLG
jgi:hypothetical protein